MLTLRLSTDDMRYETALELLRAERSKLANIGAYPDSLSCYGDIQSHRNLKARILRRIRHAARQVLKSKP